MRSASAARARICGAMDGARALARACAGVTNGERLLVWRGGRSGPVTQEKASPRGGAHAVRLARRDEAAVLGRVLADAFAEDPVFAWLIPPGVPGRDRRLRTFFTGMSRAYLRCGKPCYLAGDGSAAALWARPGAWHLPLSQVIAEAAPAAMAFRGNLLRALRTQEQIERLHAAQSPEHWYLGYLGARRDRQGQGLGTAMLREVLDGLDADGVPAYLESSNERNLTVYERNGFRVVGELEALGYGPTIWRMWRQGG
jgi:GNAT superfamily N-acetyltransferase